MMNPGLTVMMVVVKPGHPGRDASKGLRRADCDQRAANNK
jgi:hypothetical protein